VDYYSLESTGAGAQSTGLSVTVGTRTIRRRQRPPVSQPCTETAYYILVVMGGLKHVLKD